MLPLFALAIIASSTGTAPCPGTTTPEMDACQKARFDQADADLNRYYQTALKRLGKENENKAAQELVQAQRYWVSYRDAECGAVFENWSGGTIRVYMEYACQIHLTQLRTYMIWQNWLTYMDSTPAILPQPNVEAAISDR